MTWFQPSDALYATYREDISNLNRKNLVHYNMVPRDDGKYMMYYDLLIRGKVEYHQHLMTPEEKIAFNAKFQEFKTYRRKGAYGEMEGYVNPYMKFFKEPRYLSGHYVVRDQEGELIPYHNSGREYFEAVVKLIPLKRRLYR